jgi:lysophospholipase L1-like esterase
MIITSLSFSCSKEDKASSPKPNLSTTFNSDVAAGAVGDPNIKYFGRWDFTSSTTQYVSYWGGAYLRVKFTGTTVKIKVGNTSNFYAKIDNGAWTSYIGGTGTINLTPTPLASGTHTVSVAQGKDYDYVFNFQGLVLDAGATTSAPPVATDLIEWIGDSITAGYTDPQADLNDYAWVCSEAMGTEHTQIAYPGVCLVSGFSGTKPGMDGQYFKLQSAAYPSSVAWDFTKYTAKLVVINLGTNDSNDAVPAATFQSSMTTFLSSVRTKFPDAEIFVIECFKGGIMSAPTIAAINARHAAGDGKVIYIDTTNWLTTTDYTDGLHPTVAGHIKVSNLLQPILSPYLSSAALTYLDHCDATTGWASGNTLTVNTSDKKEGTGSLQSVGSSTLEFQKTFTTPLNSGASAATGSIDFWYYVSDVTKLSSSNQIEVGSGGTNDVNEYNWNIGTLVNGWNHITKTFSSAGTTGGTPNLNSINWFRIYHSKTASITTKVDAIRIIK